MTEILVLAIYRVSNKRVVSGKDSFGNWYTFVKKGDTFLDEKDVKDFFLLSTVKFNSTFLLNEGNNEYSYDEATVIRSNSIRCAVANLNYPFDIFGRGNTIEYNMLEKIANQTTFVKVKILKICFKNYEGYGLKLIASFFFDGIFYDDFLVNDIAILEFFDTKHNSYSALYKEAFVTVTLNKAKDDFATKVISGIVLK